MKKLALALALVLPLVLVTSGARADGDKSGPPATDAVSAQVFFQRGREASARGDHEGACRAFEESLRLEVAVGTLFNLARCEEELGRLASAWQHLQEGLDRLVPDDPRSPPARASASALDARVPRLTVRLGPRADARVTRDGVELSGVSLGTALPVNPGPHVVVVRAPGRAEARFELSLGERDNLSLEVAPGPLLEAAPAERHRLGAPVWIAGGAAAAALGVGLVTGSLALERSGAVRKHCKDEVCDAEGRDALAEGKRFSDVATVALVTAGAAAALGVVLWLVGRGAPAKAAATGMRLTF